MCGCVQMSSGAVLCKCTQVPSCFAFSLNLAGHTDLDFDVAAVVDKELGLLAQCDAKPMFEGHLCHPSSVTETRKGACQPPV